MSSKISRDLTSFYHNFLSLLPKSQLKLSKNTNGTKESLKIFFPEKSIQKFMFPFTYNFTAEIHSNITSKNVIDSIKDSLMERKIDTIIIDGNHIKGKEDVFKIDFSHGSPLVISPNKEEFIYHEDKKVINYRIKVLVSNILHIANSLFIFFLLHLLTKHLVTKIIISITFFMIINLISYFQYQSVIDKISKKLNENSI